MRYKEIIKHIATKEGVTVEEIEVEMKHALNLAGISCSPKEFIIMTTKGIKDYI